MSSWFIMYVWRAGSPDSNEKYIIIKANYTLKVYKIVLHLMDKNKKSLSTGSISSKYLSTKKQAINKTNGTTQASVHRNRNLLSSILNNFSMGHGIKAFSSQANHSPSSETSKNLISVDDKKKVIEYSYATTNSSKSTTSSNYETLNVKSNNNSVKNIVNVPMGPPPKTLSILQALNDLNFTEDVEEAPSSMEYSKNNCLDSSTTSKTSLNDSGIFKPSFEMSSTPISAFKKSLSSDRNTKAGVNRKFLANENFLCSSKRSINKSIQKTPTWIWKIFQLTKNGRLDLLKDALFGLDLTLIRHLVDVQGNTLMHCSVQNGHTDILEWLASTLGDQFEAALNDQNRNGRNVILTALKSGQLDCLQWLIMHTMTGRNTLIPKDGKKSLLHYAAKYNHIEATRLLCEFHVECQISVDVRDASSCTPLHLSAKLGNINIAQVLIQFGADPSCQTELGCRPSDLALKHNLMECVSYFTMAEAAASLGNDLHSLLTQFNLLQIHHETLQTHFRQVLRVSKCLVKERSDLIKHFPFAGSKSSPEAATTLLLGGTGNGVRFSDLEHKLVQAEHVWKQIESKQHGCNATDFNAHKNTKHPYALQNYLAETHPVVHASRNSSSSILEISSTSSDGNSSNSLRSSDDDDENEDVLSENEPTYHNVIQCHKTKNKSCSYLPTASSNTPWLLPSSQTSILSSLSSEKIDMKNANELPNLDLLKSVSSTSPRFSKEESSAKMNKKPSLSSLTSSPARKATTTVTPSTFKTGDTEPSAAVIEVIEPMPTRTIKSTSTGNNTETTTTFTASQISNSRNTIRISGNLDCGANQAESLSSAIENEMRTFDKKKKRSLKNKDFTSPFDSSISHGEYDTVNESEEIHFTPDLIRGTSDCDDHTECHQEDRVQHSSKHKTRKKEIGFTEENDFQTRLNFFQSKDKVNQTTQSSRLENNSVEKRYQRNAKANRYSPPSLHLSSSASSSTHSKLSNEEIESARRKLVGNFTLTNSNSTTVENHQQQNTFEKYLTVLPAIAQPEIIFPVLLQENPYSSQFTRVIDGKLTSNNLNHLAPIPSSTSRPHSSVSDFFNVALKPSCKTDLPQSSPLESTGSLNGHQSPSPSETESTLAPPPSQVSQNSQVSKTESVRGQSATLLPVSPSTLETTTSSVISYFGTTSESTEIQCLMIGRGKEESLVDQDNGSADTQMRKDDKTDSNERESEESDPYCVQSSITQPVKTTQFVAINSHKPSSHNKALIKAARRPSKPWYEIEMSDDEDERLLRVARARSRSSHASRPSYSDESENVESDEEEALKGHECSATSSCSQYNCPNFV